MVKVIPNKIQLGKVKRELVEQANLYKELTGTSRVKLVEGLLEDFFKDKILTNDFIELEKLFYFNLSELFKEGLTTATTIKPITNITDVAILKKVPINLDSFNNDLKTYCYNENHNIHRGIYLYPDLIHEDYLVIDFNSYHILFTYDISKEIIDLSLISKEDIDLYIDSENANVLSDLENESENIKNLIDEANLYHDFWEILFKPMEVFQSYKEIKRMELFLTDDIIKEYLKEHIEYDKKFGSTTTIDTITILNELLKERIEFKENLLDLNNKLEDENYRKEIFKKLSN